MKLTKDILIKIIREEIEGFFEELNERKKKPLCTDRGMNSWHRGTGDGGGQFTSPDKAKSRSVRKFNPSKKNCYKGVRRHNPSQFTSVDCGREGPKLCSKNKSKKSSKKKTNENVGDFKNCKLDGLDKEYTQDKKTKARKVKITKNLECDYANPQADQNKLKDLERLKKLKDFEESISSNGSYFRVRKDVFTQYQDWLSQKLQAQAPQKEEKLPPLKDMSDRQRKNHLFPGREELAKLAKGIVENG